MSLTIDWPELDAVADGYYAIPDPDDPGTMTYWRRIRTDRKNALTGWPAKAWYGPPVPRRSDVPVDDAERAAFVAAWSQARRAYLDRIVGTIAEDQVTAGRRFAEFRIRCCRCGRALKDETSKTYGIGPECRSGIPAAVLARYLTPEVGRIHAQALAEEAR
ncbi:DUF6011 domain-containing protein [Streptomyces sp. NPDC046374]|uniref:DUF6011 domain-containing protein n=1 Tax=Streptomyces sp. NPDC046374 TaxID=3154917 RepID=UPI0034116686